MLPFLINWQRVTHKALCTSTGSTGIRGLQVKNHLNPSVFKALINYEKVWLQPIISKKTFVQ